jgi:hypothetical protein
MLLRHALALGVPVALAAVVAAAAGPERLRNLQCRVAACPATEELSTLCRAAPAADDLAGLGRALSQAWAPPEAFGLLATLEATAPEARLDVVLDRQAALGEAPQVCPPLAHLLGAAVTVTPRRVVALGREVAALEHGQVVPAALDADGLAIPALVSRLRDHGVGRAAALQVPAALAAWPLTQLLHSLGQSGVAEVHLAQAGAAPGDALAVSLPEQGACRSCLAAPSEVARPPRAPQDTLLLAPVGRPAERPTPVSLGSVASLFLPEAGGRAFSPGPGSPAAPLAAGADLPASEAAVLAVVPGARTPAAVVLQAAAAAQRAWTGPRPQVVLAIAQDDLQGPAAAPSAERRVFLATQAVLQAARDGVAAQQARASAAAERPRPTLARQVEARRPALRACYERALKVNPRLRGRVELAFELDPSGRPQEVQVADHGLGSVAVQACLREEAARWRVASPGPEAVSVRLPLVFAPLR